MLNYQRVYGTLKPPFPIYRFRCFTHWKWWCSMAMLVYWRVIQSRTCHSIDSVPCWSSPLVAMSPCLAGCQIPIFLQTGSPLVTYQSPAGTPLIFCWRNPQIFGCHPIEDVSPYHWNGARNLVPRVHKALAILVELADGVDRQIHALVPRSLED